MSTEFHTKKSSVVPWVILFVLLLLTVSLIKGIFEFVSIFDRVAQEEVVVAELQAKNMSLERELKARQEPGFVERQIRDKLHMSKDGEVVVLLPDVREPDENEEAATEEPEKESWHKWLELLL
jgi:cell division protein FtsB